jgi:RNA polymerase sigma factor (sigma-70 family)
MRNVAIRRDVRVYFIERGAGGGRVKADFARLVVGSSIVQTLPDTEGSSAEALRPVVRAYLFGCKLQPADRDDIEQDTLLGVVRAIALGGLNGDLNGYALVTARHLVVNHFRKKHPETNCAELETPVANQPSALGLSETCAKVRRALDELSAGQRRVIWLRYWRGLKPTVISSLLRLSRRTIREHLKRAEEKLEEALAECR